MLDFNGVKVLSFDCYGTLIDWESGILSALRPLLSSRGIDLTDTFLLQLYGRFEREAQAQTPFVNYRSVLQGVATRLANHLAIELDPEEVHVLEESIGRWQPFPDTVSALKALKVRFRLAILSNVDDDLFRLTQAHLEVTFDWVITSQQFGSYKPAQYNFSSALRTMGVAPSQHVHVAQSLYHDIAPAKALGLQTVWVNRQGAASTPVNDAKPDLEVPDMQTLAGLVAGESHRSFFAGR